MGRLILCILSIPVDRSPKDSRRECEQAPGGCSRLQPSRAALPPARAQPTVRATAGSYSAHWPLPLVQAPDAEKQAPSFTV